MKELMSYPVEFEAYSTGAYLPLLLLNCLLLQKCLRPGEKNSRNGFHIPSDPEIENKINDRISFKTFLGLPFDKLSPFRGVGPSGPEADHSTFSRFRARVSKAAGREGPLARREAMIQINNEVLQAFAKKGLQINEGIASGVEGIHN
jgi:IS5 family transposase